MREIKFRIWSIGRKKMYLPGWELLDEDLVPPDVHSSTMEKAGYFLLNQGGAVFCNDGIVLDDWREDFVLMQFTGLKDKNGIEIYEGDIYETWYSRDTSGKDIVKFIEVVEWNQQDEKCGYEIPFLRNAEIIGNIYESPSLLPTTDKK